MSQRTDLSIPMPIVRARHSLTTKGQKRIFALGLLGMANERNRLFKEFVEREGLSEADAGSFFFTFAPRIEDVNRCVSYSTEFLAEFCDVKTTSLYNLLKPSTELMPTRTISFDLEDGGRTISPIYDCQFTNSGGLVFRVAEGVVQSMMDHTKGFSVVDIKLFAELDSIHSMKLLEVISANKSTITFDWKLSTFRTRFGVDYRRWESWEEIEKLSRDKRYITTGAEVGDIVLNKDGQPIKIYPAVADLKKRVLDQAFGEILSKSNGVWTATDKAGKGYELIKNGRTYEKIKFCLKFNDEKPQKASRAEISEGSEMVNRTLQMIDQSGYQAVAEVMGSDELEIIRKHGLTDNIDYSNLTRIKSVEDAKRELANLFAEVMFMSSK